MTSLYKYSEADDIYYIYKQRIIEKTCGFERKLNSNRIKSNAGLTNDSKQIKKVAHISSKTELLKQKHQSKTMTIFYYT